MQQDNNEENFATMLFCVDFRQTWPIISRGLRTGEMSMVTGGRGTGIT